MHLDSTTMRRELHPLAEIGMNVKRTSEYVLEHLKMIGLEGKYVGDTYGVCAYIDSGVPGPVVMLRADMDALPFEVDGKDVAVHACGHDSHTAMLLEAASDLIGKVKKGKVKLVFQPGEETSEGAIALIDAGILEDVDFAIGCHVRPIQDIPTGTMCAEVNHTSSGHVDLVIHGKSSHAARPHLGVNPIYVATAMINAVAQIHLDPAKAWTVKPTQIVVDDGAFNIIASEGRLTFDFRAQTNPLMDELVRQLKVIFTNCAAAYGATVDMKFSTICPAADYDPEISAELAECIKEVVGADKLSANCGGGGEDFHKYKLAKPEMKYGYFGVGVGVTPGLHKVNMTFDDTLLPMGAAVLVRAALRHVG